MKYIYRNTAVEYLFPKDEYMYSSYGDLTVINDAKIDTFIYSNFLPFEYDLQLLKKWINDYKQAIVQHSTIYSNKKIFVIKLENYHYKNLNLSDFSLINAINDFNYTMSKLPNINIIDISDFVSLKEIDYKYYYTFNAIISPLVKNEFQKWFANKLSIYTRTSKKCLVLDLDNTLWGGILSEDGIENLAISGNYPGNAFSAFQKMILELKKIGVILCIASKNDEKLVLDCFNKRDDLILEYDDFIIKKISWNEKNKAIFEIAKELNIGLDSIVFIDDNPQERDLIKSFCPAVTVLDFPQEPYLLTKYFSIEFENLFAKTTITEDDKIKSELYEKKLKADAEKILFENIDDYINNLNIEVQYQIATEYNLKRIHELINKTNTFNTTTKRYSFEELSELSQNSYISAIKVKDKFGDLGIVGCSIVKIENGIAIIDSFMLSCRVLGRKIEYTYLNMLKEKLRQKNVKEIIGIIVPTERNIVAQIFYSNAGFEKILSNDSKQLYKLEI